MRARRNVAAFVCGGAVGILGGLIGLGGAEYRLPLLLGVFGFSPLAAVIVNKAISFVVVASALPFRAGVIPFRSVLDAWPTIMNLLSGSLIGAWLGASCAARLRSDALRRGIAILLVRIATILLVAHEPTTTSDPLLEGAPLLVAGAVAGLAIGFVAALLGVAGGELLIPTLMLLFGADIKLAGSLSLAVSLPTMVVGFARYSQDRSFAVLSENWSFVLAIAAGSIVSALIGGRLLGVVPNRVLLPGLAMILNVSAIKTWRHE
jgi:uncharacterized membrane protein YfcA